MSEDPEEQAKRAAGRYAVETFVRTGHCIGLGTGSTAYYAIERAGELVAGGADIRAVGTSLETERLCREFGVPLARFGTAPIDVAIDGADEIAPDWSLIKGGGGALFREKAIALAAKSFVVVATARKLVQTLGAFALPVEVVPFSSSFVAQEIEALGAAVTVRERDDAPYVTDNGNTLLDCHFGTIEDPKRLDEIISRFHGVVTTGLFIGLTSRIIVAEVGGNVVELSRDANARA